MENDKGFMILNFGANKVPTFKEDRTKDWIIYGADSDEWRNLYPNYLLDLYRRSAKHHAIVNSKKDYIVGNGWGINNQGLTTLNQGKVLDFIKHPNQYESLDDILEKTALDLEIFNGFALEIVYDQLNEKIAAIYHADFSKYRSNSDGSLFYYSEDWSRFNPEIETIEAFDWKNPSGKQLLYIKKYHPDCRYYPLPSYLGAMSYIELDKEIANFHLNSIKNGFMGGTLMNFYNGQPTQEQQDDIERMIKEKFTNTDNANSIVLNFSDSKERGADIQQLNGNDFDKRFDILNKTVQKEIYAGHQVVDPALFGIKEEGIFTSRNQLVDSYELFKNTYINNRQAFIESVFNDLAKVQGIQARLTIKETEPISVQFSEAAVISVMSKNEIREKVGLELLEEEYEQDSKVEDAQAALKGTVGGVGGIIELLTGVKEGIISSESVISVLVELYGFTPDAAEAVVLGLPLPKKTELNHGFKDEKEEVKWLQGLKDCGDDSYEIVSKGRQFDFTNDHTAPMREAECRKYWFAEASPIDSAILDILKKNPSTPYLAIAQELQISIAVLMESLQRLNEMNAIVIEINEVIDSTQRVVKVTPKGESIIDSIKPIEPELELRYVYGLREGVKGTPIISTSRKFCIDLIGMSAGNGKADPGDYPDTSGGKTTWSLTGIQNLGLAFGWNVWQRGGGFWGKNYHCRHDWHMVLVRKKK